MPAGLAAGSWHKYGLPKVFLTRYCNTAFVATKKITLKGGLNHNMFSGEGSGSQQRVFIEKRKPVRKRMSLTHFAYSLHRNDG